uniref:carnosine N-methyltransferase n=1 Tax=Rhodosorus marinus TaxID=101924 RepID=A0A7S0G0Z0_9RHOD|mmetsp:Transcript_12928/g.18576  ORF Transcript_12928/g.18576 Transcript_12928/m.18576 type:complete len:275 (+) Transcript_12928:335-1159(+)
MDDESEQKHFLRVLKSFRAYETYSLNLLEQKKKYLHEVPKEDQELVKKLAARLNRSEGAIRTNAQFIGKVLQPKILFSNAGEIGPNSNGADVGGSNGLSLSDVDRVRTVLKQIAREWSEAGNLERHQSFQPLIDVIQEHFGKTPVSDLKNIRIFVPGAGLARLPWELAMLGYTVQGNDFSYYHLLVANYILNFTHGDAPADLNAANGSSPKSVVYPYVHQTNNVVREENQFLAVGVPDVNPRQLPTTGAEFSMIGGEFVDACPPWELVEILENV